MSQSPSQSKPEKQDGDDRDQDEEDKVSTNAVLAAGGSLRGLVIEIDHPHTQQVGRALPAEETRTAMTAQRCRPPPSLPEAPTPGRSITAFNQCAGRVAAMAVTFTLTVT